MHAYDEIEKLTYSLYIIVKALVFPSNGGENN